MVFLKEFFEKVDFEKNQQTTKKHEKLPSMQRVNTQQVKDRCNNVVYFNVVYYCKLACLDPGDNK